MKNALMLAVCAALLCGGCATLMRLAEDPQTQGAVETVRETITAVAPVVEVATGFPLLPWAAAGLAILAAVEAILLAIRRSKAKAPQ